MTAIAPRQSDVAERVAELRRYAVSVGRAFDVVRPLMRRSRLLSINARLVSARLGPDGAPFEVVAGSLDTLRAELGELIGSVEEAFGRIVVCVAHYTRVEWQLGLLGRAIEAESHSHPFAAGDAITDALQRTGAWDEITRLSDAGTLEGKLWRAAKSDRITLLENLKALVDATYALARLIERVERVAVVQTFFLGTNGLVEAARLDTTGTSIDKLALEIRDATREIAATVRDANAQAANLVTLADDALRHIDLTEVALTA